MGNQPSIKLDCQVENDSYDAGETLKGNVHLSVEGGEPVDYFDGIVMTLAGVEFLVVETDHGTTIDRTDENRFQLQTNVAKFDNGIITPGQYDFPFEMLLPDHKDHGGHEDEDALLTDSEGSDNNSIRRVSYKLRAILRRKKDVPRTSDNNIWTDAVCRNRTTNPSSLSSSIRSDDMI